MYIKQQQMNYLEKKMNVQVQETAIIQLKKTTTSGIVDTYGE